MVTQAEIDGHFHAFLIGLAGAVVSGMLSYVVFAIEGKRKSGYWSLRKINFYQGLGSILAVLCFCFIVLAISAATHM